MFRCTFGLFKIRNMELKTTEMNASFTVYCQYFPFQNMSNWLENISVPGSCLIKMNIEQNLWLERPLSTYTAAQHSMLFIIHTSVSFRLSE